MRIVIVLGLGLVVLAVSFLAPIAVAAHTTQQVTPYDPIEEYLRPGNPLPRINSCNWDNIASGNEDGTISCHTSQKSGQSIWFSYNVRTQRIVHASIATKDITVGELMLVWGEPLGQLRQGNGQYIYWRDRYAYFITRSFDPTNRVAFVAYHSRPMKCRPWLGFINRHKAALESAC
jgi:hypothetical protein